MPKQLLLEVDLGSANNGLHTFYAIEEVREFYQREFDNWHWLSEPEVRETLPNIWNNVSGAFSQIQHEIQRVEAGEQARTEALTRHLSNAYLNVRVPLSTSPVGQFIASLKADGPLVAAAAITAWTSAGGIGTTKYEHLKGAFLMAAFDANISPAVPSAVKGSLVALRRTYQEALNKAVAETAAQRDDYAQETSQNRLIIAKAIKKTRTHSRDARVAIHSEAKAAIESLQTTQKTFGEFMRLKAPVEYWTDKSKKHNERKADYRYNLIQFATGGFLSLVITLMLLLNYSLDHVGGTKPLPVYFILASVAVVLVTAIYWPTRVLTRLYLSEHHLALDADERATMAMTYLALTAEERAEPEERKLILAALFRATSDGVVKDDGAPDMSPAGVLSRMGTR